MLNEEQLRKICTKYDFTCPICHTNNAFFRLKRDICRPLDRAGDGHPQAWRWTVQGYDGIDPKLFMFGVCRKCFYTGELDEIEFRTSPRNPDAYRRLFPANVLKSLGNRRDIAYAVIPKLGELAAAESPMLGAVARFHLAVFSQCLRDKIVPGQIARYYLRLAWLYRDQERYYPDADMDQLQRHLRPLARTWQYDLPAHTDYPVKPEMALDEASALRFSREFFQSNYQNLRSASPEDELRLRFLLAEIGFRLYTLTDEEKDYKIATGYYSGTMQQCLGIISDKAITGGIINRARDMLEKCGERGRQLRKLNSGGGGKKGVAKARRPLPAKKKKSGPRLVSPKVAVPGKHKSVATSTTADPVAPTDQGNELPLEQQVQVLKQRVAELTADNEKWQALVGKDPLTGLFNKITLFRVVLPKALVNLETQGPFSFVALALDAVAQANQQHGWAMGDRLIKQAVQQLIQMLGPDEELYRLDGNQFVITTKAAAEPAMARGNALHQQLAAASIQVNQITLPMHASVGVVTTGTQQNADPLASANAIYQAIIKVLYKSRENGGDTVEFSAIQG